MLTDKPSTDGWLSCNEDTIKHECTLRIRKHKICGAVILITKCCRLKRYNVELASSDGFLIMMFLYPAFVIH